MTSNDLIVFTSGISLCHKLGDYAVGVEIYEMMNGVGVVPDRLCYGLIMSCCMHVNDVSKAEKYFQNAILYLN